MMQTKTSYDAITQSYNQKASWRQNMMSVKRLVLMLTLSLMVSSANVLAQSQTTAKSGEASTVAITASASNGAVRIAAPAQVLQIRMEVFSADGELVFDSGMRPGSIVDWRVTDANKAMPDGSYLFVVTIRDFQAKYRQKLGTISLQSGQISLASQRSGEISPVQSQALNNRRQSQKIELAEGEESVTILREGKERAVVVSANDGTTGQVTTTTGDLTLNTGDFFSNKAKEQVRITQDGRVGIGTATPGATLDVAEQFALVAEFNSRTARF
jgi:hypothetical protein